MIDMKSYLTASGTYPERESSKELTQELYQNAIVLIAAVNSLLAELGIASVKVTSGFRPSEVNAKIANAAKKSLHQQCKAVDILDSKDQVLAMRIKSRPDLLKKYGLWLEDPNSTKGKNTNWCHLDTSKSRTDRPSRVFIP